MNPETDVKIPRIEHEAINPGSQTPEGLDHTEATHSLTEEALLTYDHLPKEHRKALVRANAAIEYITEDHPAVRIHEITEPVGRERGVHFLDIDTNGGKGIKIKRLGFEVYEDMLSGKIESAHAVLPGVLTYDVEVTNGEPVTKSACRPVAIKGYAKREFEERLDRVNKEISIIRQMMSIGEHGFSPVAVVIAPSYFNKDGKGDSVFLLTELEDELFTLDNAQWHRGLDEESNMRLLEKAVSALARFNRSIGKHGDSKLKNFIQSPDGQVSVIDFETSTQHAPDELEDSALVGDIAEGDISLFLKSLKDTGFFRRLPDHKIEGVLAQILETYAGHWSDGGEELQDAVLEAAIKASAIIDH